MSLSNNAPVPRCYWEVIYSPYPFVVFCRKIEEVFMSTASGDYICHCGKIFNDTFSVDEESICPACQNKESTANSQIEFNFLKPPTMEEIETIPYS